MAKQDDDNDARTIATLAPTLTWATRPVSLPPDRRADLAAEAMLWQEQTSGADYRVATASFPIFHEKKAGDRQLSEEESERLAELLGIMGDLGERAGLAWAAYQDAQRIVSSADKRDYLEQRVILRAASEQVGHYLLGIGHGIGNLALRILLFNPVAATHINGLKVFKRAKGFEPNIDDRWGWRALSELPQPLREAAEETENSPMKVIAATVGALQGDQRFATLDRRRGMDFHRRRPQSLAHSASRGGIWENRNGQRWMGVGGAQLDQDAVAEVVYETVTEAITPVLDAMLGVASNLGDALRAEGVHFDADSEWAHRRQAMIQKWSPRV